MPSITYRHEVPFGHRLMFHKGKCKYPHGHNYVFEITIKGALDEHGMVKDFSELKESVRSFFEVFDHAFVLHKDDPFLDILKGKLTTGTGVILLPDIAAKVVVLNSHPTAENLAVLVCSAISKVFGHTAIVECWEQRDCSAQCFSKDPQIGEPVKIITTWTRDL